MKKLKKVLLWGMAAVMFCMSSITVSATGVAESGQVQELSEKEQAEIAELQRVYALPVQTNALENWPQGPGTYGEAAIVMEAETGAILYAKNIDAPHYPASITKVLTALIALENGAFTDPVAFSHDCVAFLQPGDSSVGLKEGNRITLEQALYATLLASANEAAYAVGENVGKNKGQDYAWFIGRMNERCRELGGVNSNFVNTNGLHDPQHYTCARDMALVGRELFLRHPEFFSIVQTHEYKIPASPTTEEHVFQQKHKMLNERNSNYYPYAVGGKTGYTSDALSTLITMADNGQMKLICVVLRTHGKNVYPDTRNLFEYCFQNFSRHEIRAEETSPDFEEIASGQDRQSVILPASVSFDQLEKKIEPVEGTQNEAEVTYSYRGNPVGSTRAKLSEAYMAEHGLKEATEEAPAGAGQKAERAQTADAKKQTKERRLMILGLIVLDAVLILALLIKIRLERRRKRRKTS